MAKEERVNHPAHYQGENGIEVIDVIRHYTCDIANALKYLMRAGRKQEDGMTDADKELEDLRKALWYIEDYEANCADETCGMAARPYMKSMVRHATGYSVRQICEGYPCNVAKAIELLLMVGLVRYNGIARVNNYEKYLDSAKKRVQKQVEAKAFERATGYYSKNEVPYQKIARSFFCDESEWQRNRVWHSFDEKPDLSKPVLLYDPAGNYMSPPVKCILGFDDYFVRAMNKKYGANYALWTYMDDITPMKPEELYSELNCVIKED